MPLNIPDDLPAIKNLKDENIFILREQQALRQDIWPLRIVILNLMPLKEKTETDILRLLSNSPLQVEIILLRTSSYTSKNTPWEHLNSFYKTFEEIKNSTYDGMIITGAPVEKLEFEDVDYWDEIKEIMTWSNENVNSTLYICWAAQAGLYYHYNIEKHIFPEKLFGVFKHKVLNPLKPIVRGFDNYFYAPHSRYSGVKKEDIVNHKDLDVVVEMEGDGIYMVVDKEGKKIFVTGHAEYDPFTLKYEYERDQAKGLNTPVPKNYFPDDDPHKEPIIRWTSHAHLLFSNWLNYYVYQVASYDYVKKQIKG